MTEREIERWITVHGVHVPIYKGESYDDVSDRLNKRVPGLKDKSYTPLYHGTTFKNAVAIIKSNVLKGNVSNETESFGVSTTRNQDSAYDDVALVLSKEALEQDYSIKPVYRESIMGRDLAEERLTKHIKNVDRYIKKLAWNDTSARNTKLHILRRELVQNFENKNYTNEPGSRAYYIKQLALLARNRNILMDQRLSQAVGYIEMFDRREFDSEKYEEMKAKGRIK